MSFIPRTLQSYRCIKAILFCLIAFIVGAAFVLIKDRYVMGLIVVWISFVGQFLINRTKRFFERVEPRYY